MSDTDQVQGRHRALRPLAILETRVIGVLVEKERTVADSYPLTLNALVAGCNQKNNRHPVLQVGDAEVLAAVDALRALSLVIESSGGRVMRFSQNLKRVLQVPTESVALLATLMLRGPQTAAELRMNSERLCRFSDTSSVEAFLRELASRDAGALVAELPRRPGSRENRWAQLIGGETGLPDAPPEASDAGAGGARRQAATAEAATAHEGLPVDLPQVRAELASLLERYGQALAGADAARLQELRWQSSRAIVPQAERPGQAAGTVLRSQFTCFGRDFATSLIELEGADPSGCWHEIQAWVRLPQGWRVVSALQAATQG